jgi:glycosyltransferase involved in cell wall biosynthesis
MHILFLTSSYPSSPDSPVAPFVRSIAESMCELGHSVNVIAPYTDGATHLSSQSSNLTVTWVRYAPFAGLNVIGHGQSLENDQRVRAAVYAALPFYVIATVVAALKSILRQRPDVIHAHWVIVPGVLGAILTLVTGIPLVISLHGSDMYLAVRSPVLSAIARFAFSRSRGVAACSPDLALGARTMSAHNVALIPHGVDPAMFAPAADRKGYLRILSLGRLVAKKGVSTLIKAIAPLLKAEGLWRLVIAGDGPERRILEEISDKFGVSDRIEFLGSVKWRETPALFADADVFVLPSIVDIDGNVDGLPTTILEAMATGLPIVASNVGGVSLVIEEGVNGLLVEPGNEVALREAISRLLYDENLRMRMTEANLNKVRNGLTWRDSAMSIQSLYGA